MAGSGGTCALGVVGGLTPASVLPSNGSSGLITSKALTATQRRAQFFWFYEKCISPEELEKCSKPGEQSTSIK